MAGAWPWLAVAALGALHGANPATGWAAAAAAGLRAGDRAQVLRALAPIALGHLASVGAVAALVALGFAAQRGALQWFAAGLAAIVLAVHFLGHARHRLRVAAGRAGLALGSFAAGTAHGAGMMLVPALVPVCLSATPGREIVASGAPGLALAAVAVHLAAMLAVTGALATAACRGGSGLGRRWRAARMPLAVRYQRNSNRHASSPRASQVSSVTRVPGCTSTRNSRSKVAA